MYLDLIIYWLKHFICMTSSRLPAQKIMVMHACNLSIREAMAGGLLRVLGQTEPWGTWAP